ncbi:MAG TPA: response regulator [Ktedonobacterales bacterium]|nr:response regulator [Ktedonobacterales bacterium]
MSERSKTIIVVDDEPDIVFALTLMLGDAGYHVIAVSQGDDLIRLLRSEKAPDLILLDMLLAGRDGREIVRELKANPFTRSIPVLMMSAHPRAAQEAADAGADGFLAKPFELETLVATVAALLH